MRWTWLLFSLLLGLAVAQDSEEVSSEDVGELPLAEPCNQQACQLPDCLCSSTNIPGGLTARNTPQFVLATFDDGVNIINIETYRDILYNRRNSNGCPTGTTFFVSHEYTNYQLVNELYNRGFEIALHSISHRTPQVFWANSTYEDMVQEFADQRVQMSHFGNIPYDELRGIRIPFLQLAGNNSFQVMADFGITYDSTWVTVTHTNPGMWPYTLDYASTQDCMGPPCPTSSIPGVWVKPMVSWEDLEGFPCAMVDACIFPPDREDEQAWYEFIVSNFERHYLGNRAPFGFYIHQWYLDSFPAVQRAFVRFMDLINSLNDVFMVNAGEVIDWVKDPIPVNVYRERPCRTHIPTFCMPQSCNVIAEHNGFEYWMQICNVCPARYPWVGNPLGQ